MGGKIAIGMMMAVLPTLAAARDIDATPATLARVLGGVRDGDRVTLAPGEYGLVGIVNRRWAPAVTIDARAATMRLRIQRVQGLRVEGGRFAGATGPGRLGYAAEIGSSGDVALTGGTYTQSIRGIVIGHSDGVTISKATLTGLSSDGIDIAQSRNVTVQDSTCRDFSPRKGDHPDCIQAWSRPNKAPTSDIRILRNTAEGKMQGVFFGNHVRQGVDDGGFDRVTLRSNTVRGTYVNGIALFDCRDCAIDGNVASSLPGSPNRVIVRVENCIRCTVRNNKGEGRSKSDD